ncbi:MAG: DsbA family protein [Micrococcales bacterium]
MNQPHKPTRSEQREAARTKAKELREQHKKNEKRKGLFIKLGLAAGIVAVAAIIAGVVLTGVSNESGQSETPTNLTANNGLLIGAGGAAILDGKVPAPVATPAVTGKPVRIVTYIDYQCPYCAHFENANLKQIKGWLDTGFATLEVRVLSFLDGRGSPNTYSSRAANAALAVAKYAPNKFFAFNEALFQNQPAENTKGPENDDLIKLANSLGINSTAFENAVKNKDFGKWITTTTSKALSSPVSDSNPTVNLEGTPLVLVNGQSYTGAIDNAAEFSQFVTGIAAAK